MKVHVTHHKSPNQDTIGQRHCMRSTKFKYVLKIRKRKFICTGLLVCFFIVYGRTLLHIYKEFISRINYDKDILIRGIEGVYSKEIPKVIHQIFFNISENRHKFMKKYEPYRQTWKDLNPDYKYILWNATMIHKLVNETYPQIKPIFEKYKHTWISQADMARYLVVHHMGGVYADIDVKCRRSLSQLFKEAGYKLVILEPGYNPIGFNIDFLAAARNHTFMSHVIAGLEDADVMYISHHSGIIFRTGPMFMLGRYLNYPFKDQIYQIPREDVDLQVEREHAGSWHGFDELVFKIIEKAPVFTASVSPINVAENEGQLLLYTLTVSDPNNEQLTCSVQSTDPSTSFFGVWPDSSDFGLYLKSGSTLVYSAIPVYTVTLACSNDVDTAVLNVTVNVIPNTPPSFSNLPDTRNSLNANGVNMGDTVYTVTATDTDSPSLTFSMTSNPASPDLFAIDPVSGKITATQDLTYAIDSAYDLTITVSDSIDSTTNNLIIPIHNFKTAPIIDNLPNTINVQEDAGGNTVLFTLSVSSPNGVGSTTVTYVVSPSVYTAKFTLDNYDLKITGNNQKFNYEDQNTFNVTFTISDSVSSTGGYVLTVNVIDVNENCDFHFNDYFLIMHEASAGGSTVDPQFNVTDEDAGSSFTYSLQNVQNASYFTIDPSLGLISFAVDYDVDITHTNDIKFNVYCTDNYGSTGIATLYLTIEDVNDNAPTFGTSFILVYFDQRMSVPYNLTTLTATDADSGLNAQLHFSWSTTGSGSSYFILSPNGDILLTKDPQPHLNYGEIFTFIVTVGDRGTPSLTGTTTLELIYREINGTTPITTTGVFINDDSSGDSFGDKPSNIIALVLGLLLAGILFAGVVYFAWKYLAKMPVVIPKAKKVQPQAKEVDKHPIEKQRHYVKDDQSSITTERQYVIEGRHPSPAELKPSFDFWHNNEFQSYSSTVYRTVGQSGYSDFPGYTSRPPPVV